jgi:hypothetical protein
MRLGRREYADIIETISELGLPTEFTQTGGMNAALEVRLETGGLRRARTSWGARSAATYRGFRSYRTSMGNTPTQLCAIFTARERVTHQRATT